MSKQVIWLMTDTTRYDMVGCYGFPQMQTPAIDALAARGVRYEYAYSTQPVCGPARSTLFTGLFPHENGCWGNCMPLGQGVRTIGQRLSQAGIRCGYIGKWHLDGGDYFGNGICPEGWDPDCWYDMKCYLDELGTDEARQRSRHQPEGGVEASFTYGHRCASRAIDYLERHSSEDLLLVVSFDEPHGPSLCPEPYASMYRDMPQPDSPSLHDNLENKPDYQRIWAQTASKRGDAAHAAALLGCNSFIDSEIGRVLEAVQRLAPDALVLFTSDHGAALDAHQLSAKGAAVYDEIARIPLIFAGGPCQTGAVRRHVVSHADVPATVLDYMGLDAPPAFTGRSLMGDLAADDGRDGLAYIEFNRYERDHDGFGGFQPMRAIVTDEWKLALHLTDLDELYHTPTDPCNLRNLIADPGCAEARNRLHDRLLDWMNHTRDPFRGYQWQCRPWRPDRTPSWEVDGYTRQPENEPGEPRQLDYATGLTMASATRSKQSKEVTHPCADR